MSGVFCWGKRSLCSGCVFFSRVFISFLSWEKNDLALQVLKVWWSGDPRVNPFLFISRLSYPTILRQGYPYNLLLYLVVTLAFKKKNRRSSISLEIRRSSAFTASRAPLPTAAYSSGWSGQCKTARCSLYNEHFFLFVPVWFPCPQQIMTLAR